MPIADACAALKKKKHRRTHFAAKSPVFFGTFSCDPR